MQSFVTRCAVGFVLLSIFVHAQQPQTIQQGIYTAAQATRGQAVYKEKCASCHGATLGGGNFAPPLAGNDFLAGWRNEPVWDLFRKIKNTMPADTPGKLTDQQNADVLAYMLQVAKFPAGRAELQGNEAALKPIRFPAGAPASAAVAQSAAPAFPPVGNMNQVMRGILFPSSNIIFTVQTHDPAEKRKPDTSDSSEGFNFVTWGNGIYTGWDLVDYAAVALAESAPLMLTPGRRCENGRPVPVNDPEWIKFTNELAEAGKAAYRASQSRSQEAVSEVSNQVSDACMNCHQVYRDNRARGATAPDRSLRCVR